MARYTYKEIGDNKDSDCLTTVIYDGMDIMAIVYDYGEEVEVEPKRDLTDEESNMVKQFCESLDYDARQKINESISIGENVDILDIYKQAREDFGELNQKSSLNESVKKKPETINEKLKRLDRKVFDEEFKTLDLAYNYSMINEDVVGKKVDMKTKQELRDFINREDDPNKIAKFMDVIINGDDNKKPNQLNNQRVQQSNIRTEGVITEERDTSHPLVGKKIRIKDRDEGRLFNRVFKITSVDDGTSDTYINCYLGNGTTIRYPYYRDNGEKFIMYDAPYDAENQDINESLITEAKEQSDDIMEIFNRNGWTVMKQGAGLMAYNYVIEHGSTIELNQNALANFLENENHLIDDLDALSEDITFSFNATQEGHPTGTVTDWRRDSVEESLNEDYTYKMYMPGQEGGSQRLNAASNSVKDLCKSAISRIKEIMESPFSTTRDKIYSLENLELCFGDDCLIEDVWDRLAPEDKEAYAQVEDYLDLVLGQLYKANKSKNEALTEAFSNTDMPEDVVKYCEYYFGGNPANLLTFNEDGTITLSDDYDDYEFEDMNQFINDMRYNIQATREMIEEDPDAYDEEEKEAVGL